MIELQTGERQCEALMKTRPCARALLRSQEAGTAPGSHSHRCSADFSHPLVRFAQRPHEKLPRAMQCAILWCLHLRALPSSLTRVRLLSGKKSHPLEIHTCNKLCPWADGGCKMLPVHHKPPLCREPSV